MTLNKAVKSKFQAKISWRLQKKHMEKQTEKQRLPADVEEAIVWSPLQGIYRSLTKQVPYDGFEPLMTQKEGKGYQFAICHVQGSSSKGR